MNTEIFEQFEQFEEFDELKEMKIEKMIDVQFSEEGLRSNFELLLKVLKNHRISLNNLEKSNNDSLKSQIDQNKENISELQQEIKALKENKPNSQTTVIQQQFTEPTIDQTLFDQLKENDENQSNEINLLKDQLKQQQEKSNQQYQNLIIKINEKEDAMNERMQDLNDNISKLKEQIEELLEKQRMMNELRNSINGEENATVSNDIIVELKFQINKQGKQLTETNEKLKDFINRTEFNDFIQNNDQKIIDFQNDQEEKHNQIDLIIENLRNLFQLYVPINEFEEKTEQISKTAQQQLDHLKHTYLQEKFLEIQTNIDYFTEEIGNSKSSIIQLFNLFNQLNSGLALINEKGQDKSIVPIIQQDPIVDYSQKILLLDNQVKNTQNSLYKIQQQQMEHVDNYKNFVQQTENNYQKLIKVKLDKTEYHPQIFIDQIKGLRDKINMIYNQYQSTDLQVKQSEEDIQIIFSKLSQKTAKIKEITDQREPQGIDEEKVMMLIKKSIEIPLNDLQKIINEIDKKLYEKAEKNELDELSKLLSDLMDQLKNLADKKTTKKGLLILEKKINELFQLVTGEDKDKNLDGLLVKRPLGWSCCSCDKELNNYQGLTGEHINWAHFPPKETIPLRMGKYAMYYTEVNKYKSPQQSLTKTTGIDQDNQNQSSLLYSPRNQQLQSNEEIQNVSQTAKQAYSMYTLRPVFNPKSKAYKIIKNDQPKMESDNDMKVQGKKTNDYQLIN